MEIFDKKLSVSFLVIIHEYSFDSDFERYFIVLNQQNQTPMNLLVIAYIIIGAMEVLAEATGNSTLRFVTKPLLMPVLMLFYHQSTKLTFSSFDKKIMMALFFSWFGDVFLMFVFKNELFFLAGLGSFLLAHIFYVIAFTAVTNKSAEALLPKKAWILIPLIAYFVMLMVSFFSKVPGEMKIPVAVYSATIAAMVAMAVNRYKRVNDKSFSLVMAGALLFMLSDSIIAVNKFLYQGEMAFAGVGIMVLYISGQYFIAKGASKQ
jgi:uncharacterized membrane protein YhhN